MHGPRRLRAIVSISLSESSWWYPSALPSTLIFRYEPQAARSLTYPVVRHAAVESTNQICLHSRTRQFVFPFVVSDAFCRRIAAVDSPCAVLSSLFLSCISIFLQPSQSRSDHCIAASKYRADAHAEINPMLHACYIRALISPLIVTLETLVTLVTLVTLRRPASYEQC